MRSQLHRRSSAENRHTAVGFRISVRMRAKPARSYGAAWAHEYGRARSRTPTGSIDRQTTDSRVKARTSDCAKTRLIRTMTSHEEFARTWSPAREATDFDPEPGGD